MNDIHATHTSASALPARTTLIHDLYRDIHKAIRVSLFDVTAEAGRLDPGDCTARMAHAGRVRDLVRFLVLHAEHEDAHIDAAIQRVVPAVAAQVGDEHTALEERMASLVEIADLAFVEDRSDARAATHTLYVELAAFTSSYLAHQDLEERVVMPALCAALDLDQLLAIHGSIIQSISPEDMGLSLSLMLPAMNVDDRTELLGGMKATAPAEAFAGVWALAGQVLRPDDVDELAARLDVARVG